MQALPSLTISLPKITHNTKIVVSLCHAQGIEVLGVTKGVVGSLEVAKAMVGGGVDGLADCHPHLLRSFREANLKLPLQMIRQPMQYETEEVAEIADTSLISESEAVEKLDEAASIRGRCHGILVMVELGSLREGAREDEVFSICEQVEKAERLSLEGLAVYCSTLRDGSKDLQILQRLAVLYQKTCSSLGRKLPVLSGGNSSGIYFLLNGNIPEEVNQLRVGEAILLGHETATYQLIPGAVNDAFMLEAEVIEVKRKPKPTSPRRTIVALGFETIGKGLVFPQINANEVMRASNHLVLEVGEDGGVRVGDTLSFRPGYFALLTAMMSPFVQKVYQA